MNKTYRAARISMTLLATGVLAMAALPAAADGGRINFTGAIVNGTCDPGAAPTARASMREVCPGIEGARYTRNVEPASQMRDNQLISYYEGYLLAAGQTEPVMVTTQVYE